jgi:hypothetical protein
MVGDGDPHTVIRPDTVAPRTPTELLRQILARDDAPTSATTLLGQLSDPAARLFDAIQRYTDGLHVAAEHLVGPQMVGALDGQADKIVPDLTSEPSWPTLRARLLALAAETGSIHSSTCRQPPPDENSTPPGTWPPCSNGASQSPHPLTQDRCPGFPAYRRRFMIITFGACTSRSDRSSSSSSQLRLETEQAITANSQYGHRRAATRATLSSVKSRSGGAAVGVDPEDRRPTGAGQLQTVAAFGNRTSTETFPCAATTLAQM